jgi:hypothetical protein
MAITRAAARSQLFSTLSATWLGDPASQSIPLFYADFNDDDLPSGREGSTADIQPFAKAEVTHTSTRRASLGTNPRIRAFGTLDVFVHTAAGDALVKNDVLCQVIETGFRAAKPPSLYIRDVVSAELGRSGAWSVARVKIDFEYEVDNNAAA